MCLLLSGADPGRSCGYHLTLCEFICVFILLIQRPLLPWRPPSSLALPLFLPPPLWGSLSPEERDLMRYIVLLFRDGCFKFSCSLHDAWLWISASVPIWCRGRFSSDDWIRHWSTSTAEYHLESFYCYVLLVEQEFRPRSSGYLVSDY